ncbi:MAG: monofunctional biosynthetic peptidoglycan transglycosylase [Nitrospirae bacterium]|nr:monofunctional biosynthetic peptidoglycan transglycosylase [Nitrospirota bacterium]
MKKLLAQSIKIFIFLIAGLILWVGFYILFPNVSALKTKNPDITSFMQYRFEQAEEKGKKLNIRKSWAPLSSISPYLAKAVIIAEDDKFWRHEGFDFEAIQKAIENDIKTKKMKFGGSTISQQLAKNLYLSPAKNPVRKIKEAILTWRIEKSLSKKRILEIYLNVAEWGNGIFGAEAASRHYFGKPASALSPIEAARLAVVLPNPKKLSPVSDSAYIQRRANLIYSIMVRRGIVSEEYQDAVGETSTESEETEAEGTEPGKTDSE